MKENNELRIKKLLEAIAEFRGAFKIAVGDSSPFARLALGRLDAVIAENVTAQQSEAKEGCTCQDDWFDPACMIHGA